MTGSGWVWNDANIADDAILYRRVPRKPDCQVLDLETGKMMIKPGALRYDRADGLSIHRDDLLKSHYGVGASAVCVNWTTHGAIQFTAWDVRNVEGCRAGVHDEPDLEDERIGLAHALVRCPDPGYDKETWNPVRAAIARAATWIDGP